MRISNQSARGLIALVLVCAMLITAAACALAVNAQVVTASDQGAGTYYFWGVASNDPDFGAMSSPVGTFSYDGTKGYYYFDLSNPGGSGDYCFVVSAVGDSGATAVRSPAVGGVQNAGDFYLSQGNYHGYACMHIWNPSGTAVRIYFTSESAGLNCIAQSQAGETSTTYVNPTTPVNPSTSTSGYVYCENAAGWGAVYAYMWNSDTDKNAAWPGVRMDNVSGSTWRCQVNASYANIIFNIGSDQTQTDDMSFPGTGYVYNNKTQQWRVYGSSQPSTSENSTASSESSTSYSEQTSATTPSIGKNVVYCENEAGWSKVNAYMWNSDSDKNAAWPGATMTKIGGNIWQYTVPKNFANIIFNDGSDSNKTADLTFPGYGYIYNNKTMEWSIYDTSPLQVQAFTTDLPAPQHAGVAITLSATAAGQGTVFYKFSVSGSTGAASVLSDYSTKNSVVWTPQIAGTYSLIYEFKDAKGNTNKRTLSYSVTNGSASVAPFIKQVTPAAGQLIKKSAACSVTVSAGGGITGTNLLFYKYTVTDASGKTVNVPYYTRNTNYSFTPTALGNYTVTVSVQGPDNTTVERSLTYTSVNTVPDSTQAATPGETTSSDPTPGGKKGDSDKDGDVTILDATRIQRWLASLITDADIDKTNADADGDGSVTILDATRIQRFLAGLITKI